MKDRVASEDSQERNEKAVKGEVFHFAFPYVGLPAFCGSGDSPRNVPRAGP